MPKRKVTPRYIADHIRRVLKDGGSAPHAEGVQKFFKEEIQSRGWRTAEMRKVANRFRQAISRDMEKDFLVQVADQLFRGRVLEERVFAVLLLEKITSEFGDSEFTLFESRLDRLTSWADHDGLVHYLIGPMLVASPARKRYPFRWASHRSAGIDAQLASHSFRAHGKGCFSPKSRVFPTVYLRTMMTWCKKV